MDDPQDTYNKLINDILDGKTYDTEDLSITKPSELAEQILKDSFEDTNPIYDVPNQDIVDAIANSGPELETIYKKPESIIDNITRPLNIAVTAAKDGITNMFSSDVKTASNYALTSGEQAGYSVFQNVGRWLDTTALAAGTAMTGGLLSAGLGALKAGSILMNTITSGREVYKGIYEDAISRGLSEEEAKDSAFWGTAMSMPFEYIGERYIGKVLSKPTIKSLNKQLVKAGAARKIFNAKGKQIGVQIIDKDLAEKIITNSRTLKMYDAAGTVANEMSTELVQGRLENAGILKNDPNMQLEDVFQGSVEDALLGGIGAGTLHGIAKGIEVSPIGKFASKRIAEMHRRRFDLNNEEDENEEYNGGTALIPLSLSKREKQNTRSFDDNFYQAHTLIDSDTQQVVNWENIQDEGHYDIMYHDGYVSRNVTGKQAKVYAQKLLRLKIDPKTRSVTIPADIEYEGAKADLVVDEDGKTTIVPNTDTLSDNPEDEIENEEKATEQVNQTRATIMKSQGLSDEQVNAQSTVSGAANQKTFGKSDIDNTDVQNEVFGKPDTVESEEDADTDNYITSYKLARETNKIASSAKKGKPYNGLVSTNHVLSAINKFAKKFIGVTVEPTLKTEGTVADAKKGTHPQDPDYNQDADGKVGGQINTETATLRIRESNDALAALHELGHYIFKKGKRGVYKVDGKKGGLTLKDKNIKSFKSFLNIPYATFAKEMKAMWDNVLNPGDPNPYAENEVTKSIDEWTEVTSPLKTDDYKQTSKLLEEYFIESFVRYVTNQRNKNKVKGDDFRTLFAKYAPETFKAFEKYLKDQNLEEGLKDVTNVYQAYASQDIETRSVANTTAVRPGMFQKTMDDIRTFIGEANKLSSIISKTYDDTQGYRAAARSLGDPDKNIDKFERIRGQAFSAIQSFISGNGMKFGIGDLIGTKFKNYETIIRNVRKLKSYTDSKGNVIDGLRRFSTYVVAKNTIGETIGNQKLTNDIEKIAKEKHQSFRTTRAELLDIQLGVASAAVRKKYQAKKYQRILEEIRTRSEWIGTPETIKEAFDVIEAEEKRDDFDKLEESYNDLQYLWKAVQDYVAAMSPSMSLYVEALRAGGAGYYTPLMRQLLGASKNYNAVLTEREGSALPSYSVVENVPYEISALINAGLRAYTKDMLIKLANMPNSGVYIQEVREPIQAIDMGELKKGILKEIYKQLPAGSEIPQTVLNTLALLKANTMFLRDPGKSDVTGNVFSAITVNSKMEPELRYYKVDPSILTLLKNSNLIDTDGTLNDVINLLNFFNRMQKNFFTKWSLKFVLYVNVARDIFTCSLKGNQVLFDMASAYDENGKPLYDPNDPTAKRFIKKTVQNDWLNALAGTLVGAASMYVNWITQSEQWQKYEDAMSVMGVSTNQKMNEYNAILSRTKPSANYPLGRLGFLTSDSFEKLAKRLNSAELIIRSAELKFLLKRLGADVEEVYLSEDRVSSLMLSKNKLESLGLTYKMLEPILTEDQRTMWQNTNSKATLTLNLEPGQIVQIRRLINKNNIRTTSVLTDEQITYLNREAAQCTTDFLKHGQVSDALNIIMLFSRAGINGTAQYANIIDRRRLQNNAGQIYGRIVSGAIYGWLFHSLFKHLLVDDDEDEEDMWNGIRIKIGDTTIDIPVLPEDLLGWNIGKTLSKGDFNFELVKHFAASINPIKSAGFGGLVSDLLSGRKLSRVGWDDWTKPIIPDYLKQKFGENYEKMVSYNTGLVARSLAKAFGGAPATWQYAINNMGFGKIITLVEASAGVDKSILMPDGSVIPTGNGALDYVMKQVGINRPLYRTKYERKLDKLYNEAMANYNLSPNSEEARANYLLLYNTTQTLQNLNKIRFYATSPDQQKELVKMKARVAKNSYEMITGDTANLEAMRSQKTVIKRAVKSTQEQLQEGEESTPIENIKTEANAEIEKKRKKGSNVFETIWNETLGGPKDANAADENTSEGRSHPLLNYVETGNPNEDFSSYKKGRVGPNHLMGYDLIEFTKYITGGDRSTLTKDKKHFYTEYSYKPNSKYTELLATNPEIAKFKANTIKDTQSKDFENAYKILAKEHWFQLAYKKFVNSKYNPTKDIPAALRNNDAIREMGYSIKNHAGSYTKILSDIKNPNDDARTYLRQMYNAVDNAKDSRVAVAKTRHLREYYILSKYLEHLQTTNKDSDVAKLATIIEQYNEEAKDNSKDPIKIKKSDKYVLKTADDIDKLVWGDKK